MTVRIKPVLVAGLTLTATAVLVVLLHSPVVIAAGNGVPEKIGLAAVSKDSSFCQGSETLPAGTSAIRGDFVATVGPPVTVEAFAGGGAPITTGGESAGWYGTVVTARVTPVHRTFSNVTVCFQLSELTGNVLAVGGKSKAAVAATLNGTSLPGRLGIAYLRPGRQSWLSQVGAVVHHMGLGRAWSGAWIVLPIAALMMAAIATGCWALCRELR